MYLPIPNTMVGPQIFLFQANIEKSGPLAPVLTGNNTQNPRKNVTYTDKLENGYGGGSFKSVADSSIDGEKLEAESGSFLAHSARAKHFLFVY